MAFSRQCLSIACHSPKAPHIGRHGPQTTKLALMALPSPFTAKELERSRPFDRYLVLEGEAGNAAVDALVAALEVWETAGGHIDSRTGEVLERKRARKATDVAALRSSMSAVAANLFALERHRSRLGQFLAIGFAHGEYPLCGPLVDRYRRSELTANALVTVRGFLVGADLVDFVGGFRKPDGSLSRLSRMRARAALVETLEAHGVTLANVGSSPLRELVILKGTAPTRRAAKPLLPYDETDKTREWREKLGRVNALLEAASIDYPAGVSLESLEEPIEEIAGDLTAKTLHRVFNDGRWDHGGRLYGGHWECAPKAWRRRLTIDGETTAELDFKALHPCILYGRLGLPMEGDPYVVEIDGEEVCRDLGKVTFQRLLNGTTKAAKLRPAPGDLERLPKGVRFGRYAVALHDKHAPIAHLFGTSEGVRLQFMDSQMVMEVLADLSLGRGIVALPVHDSFIVQARHKEALRTSMRSAFRKVVGMGIEPVIEESGT